MNLRYLPVGLFTSVMGICGLSIAFQRCEQVFNLRVGAGIPIVLLAFLIFLVLALAYVLKTIRHFSNVNEEFGHPVKMNFFPAISISLLLISVGTLDLHRELARCLWTTGSIIHLIFTVVIISRWVSRGWSISQANPAWFLPVVGNIIVPIAGVEFADIELAWFFFSVGFFFWLIVFTVVFYRVVFCPRLPDKIMPTLFIFIAPPALGFISYTRITGHLDGFARGLLYLAIMLVIILCSLFRDFYKLDFNITWWAGTFPLAAVTIATLTAFKMSGQPVFAWLGVGLISLTTLAVGTVLYKTVVSIKTGRVCLPD